jgi:hypothetical protein
MIVARQGAKMAPPKTTRTAARTRLAERGREAEQPQEQDPATEKKTCQDQDFLGDR